MILTVTPNPTVDRVLFAEEFVPGGMTRCYKVVNSVGGKSLDAAVALQALGAEQLALLPLAGMVGRQVATLVDAYGIPHDDIWVEGETRVAHVLVEMKHRRHSHITAGQITITPEQRAELFRRYAGHLPAAAWVVTGGSLPPGLREGFYAELIAAAGQQGVPVLVDASGPPVLATLAANQPAVLKMNRGEYCATFGVCADSAAELVVSARALAARCGLPALVLTAGGEGLWAVVAGQAYHACAPEQIAVNAAGAGDAASGALAYRLALGDDWPTALRWAAATSAASVLTEGTADCKLEDVMRLLPATVVEAV